MVSDIYLFCKRTDILDSLNIYEDDDLDAKEKITV